MVFETLNIDACAAPGWGLSVIDEFVSLVNPVLFEPPFPPEGSRTCGQTPRYPKGYAERYALALPSGCAKRLALEWGYPLGWREMHSEGQVFPLRGQASPKASAS